MLHILLLILKIIGIVLLCILGVLILGIVCALFVPVRYRIEAVRKEGGGEPPVTVTVKVTWLLHLLNVLVRFAGSLSVRVRLMVFTVFRLPKRGKRGGRVKNGKKRKKGNAQEPKTGDEEGESENAASAQKPAVKTAAESLKERDTAADNRDAGQKRTKKKTKAADATNNREKDNGETNAKPGTEADKKPALWEKLRAIPEILRNIFVKIKSIFENIQYTIQNICDKIGAVSDTIEYYRGVIEGEPFQRSFALCKEELLLIFKRLKPDRFEAALVVGMDDPAATGEILAVCGMLYPVLGPKVNVVGDFERKRLEGRVFIKGKLRFFTFVRVAVRMYFNKDIRKLYGLLKKEAA